MNGLPPETGSGIIAPVPRADQLLAQVLSLTREMGVLATRVQALEALFAAYKPVIESLRHDVRDSRRVTSIGLEQFEGRLSRLERRAP